MSTPSYYLCDAANDEVVSFDNLTDALAYGKTVIGEYRDNCDPEWPAGVDDIVVVFGTPDEKSDEPLWQQLDIVATSKEVNRVDFDTPEEAEAAGCEYMCDYAMVVA